MIGSAQVTVRRLSNGFAFRVDVNGEPIMAGLKSSYVEALAEAMTYAAGAAKEDEE